MIKNRRNTINRVVESKIIGIWVKDKGTLKNELTDIRKTAKRDKQTKGHNA
jgi:hypothetical protein